jgi:vacuolar-type H+-ATPase subunit H
MKGDSTMSSAPIGGYPPPIDDGRGEVSPTTQSSTTDVAKDQVGQVGQTAKESGKQVASTAAEEATNVVSETRRQAKDMTREVSNQVQEQAAVQKAKAAERLRSLGEELRSMAAQGGQSGPASDLAQQAADKVTDLAQWIDQRDPGSLVEEFRTLARRKPGAFLMGAAAAGVLAGRLTRGAVQAAKSDSSNGSGGSDISDGALPSSGAPGSRLAPAAGSYGDDATPIGDVAAAEADVRVQQLDSAPTTLADGTYAKTGQSR